MKNLLIPTIILTLIFFSIYSYKLPQSFTPTSDFGRDIYQSIKIAQGDLILIGSKMNLGGYFAGPYLYYLLALFLFLGNFDISLLLYFHTMLFAGGLGFSFWMVWQKFGPFKAALGILMLGLMPLYIMSSRYPSNGYSYLALLLPLMTYIFFSSLESKKVLLILGILSGVIFNIHPISILTLFFVFFYILFSLKRKWSVIFFLGAFLITLIPLIIFEVRHDFIMTKDTFINKSYLTFTKDGYTPQFWLSENKFISSFLFISQKFKNLITLPPIIYFSLAFFVLGIIWLKKRKLERVDLFLSSAMVLSLPLLIGVLRFHFEEHYIFSVAFLIPFAASLILLRSNFWIFLLVIVLLQIQNFPKNLYQNSNRSLYDIERAVKFSLDQNLVSKTIPFNLIHIYDAYGLVPTGFEYRFFFRKFGFRPNSEYDYQNSKVLLIFSETPYYDIDRFKMWATEQFGREYFSKRDIYHVGKIAIYRISKK